MKEGNPENNLESTEQKLFDILNLIFLENKDVQIDEKILTSTLEELDREKHYFNYCGLEIEIIDNRSNKKPAIFIIDLIQFESFLNKNSANIDLVKKIFESFESILKLGDGGLSKRNKTKYNDTVNHIDSLVKKETLSQKACPDSFISFWNGFNNLSV